MIRTKLDEVEKILIDLGVESGDKLLIHADLRIFGLLEGNGEGLINLLKNIVEPDGLICTPSFTFSFPDDFDVKNSRSNIGALTNLFGNFDDVSRVPDGMTSYYLIGKDSKSFINNWNHSSYGENSIIDQLLKKNGKVLQIGTDILSPIHYIEELVGVPYRKVKKFEGLIIDNDLSYHSHTNFYARVMNVKKIIPDPIRSEFYAKQKDKIELNGRELRLFSIEDFVSFALPRLKENKLILIEE